MASLFSVQGTEKLICRFNQCRFRNIALGACRCPSQDFDGCEMPIGLRLPPSNAATICCTAFRRILEDSDDSGFTT